MTSETDAEEREFQRLWGPWDDLTSALAAELLEGVSRPWWISGGWAIEAYTRVARLHKDVDVTVFRRDVQELRRHFHGRYDLWSAGSATLRPLDDAHPLPRWSGQVRVRAHAFAPWLLDVVLNPGGPRWMFKRDRSITFPLEEATWIAADGVRYLRPSSSSRTSSAELVRSTTAISTRRFRSSTRTRSRSSSTSWSSPTPAITGGGRSSTPLGEGRASGPAIRATNALR